MDKKNNVALRAKTYAIDRPLQVVKMATILKSHIVKYGLYASIAGKNYVMVEGWQFAGGLMGLFPRVVKVEEIAKGKWFAQVDIVDTKTNKTVSSGFAICSKEEGKKKSFDEYAILSMAQTRAIGKAYRNLIGWTMKLAGYESTPAEEMRGKVDNKVQEEKKEVKNILAGTKEKTQIERYCKELGANDPDKAYDLIKKLTGIEFNDKLNKTDALIIITTLLQKQTAKKNGKRN